MIVLKVCKSMLSIEKFVTYLHIKCVGENVVRANLWTADLSHVVLCCLQIDLDLMNNRYSKCLKPRGKCDQ